MRLDQRTVFTFVGLNEVMSSPPWCKAWCEPLDFLWHAEPAVTWPKSAWLFYIIQFMPVQSALAEQKGISKAWQVWYRLLLKGNNWYMWGFQCGPVLYQSVMWKAFHWSSIINRHHSSLPRSSLMLCYVCDMSQNNRWNIQEWKMVRVKHTLAHMWGYRW